MACLSAGGVRGRCGQSWIPYPKYSKFEPPLPASQGDGAPRKKPEASPAPWFTRSGRQGMACAWPLAISYYLPAPSRDGIWNSGDTSGNRELCPRSCLIYLCHGRGHNAVRCGWVRCRSGQSWRPEQHAGVTTACSPVPGLYERSGQCPITINHNCVVNGIGGLQSSAGCLSGAVRLPGPCRAGRGGSPDRHDGRFQTGEVPRATTAGSRAGRDKQRSTETSREPKRRCAKSNAKWKAQGYANLVATQAYTGDIAGAKATAAAIDDALQQSFALNYIAAAQAGLGRIAEAEKTAARFSEKHLRASAFVSVAAATEGRRHRGSQGHAKSRGGSWEGSAGYKPSPWRK